MWIVTVRMHSADGSAFIVLMGVSQGSSLKHVQEGKEMDQGKGNGSPSSPGIGQRAAALSLPATI